MNRPSFARFLVSAYGPTLFASFGFGAIIPLIPILAGRMGASLGLAAFVTSLTGIGTVLGDLPAGVIAGRLGERKALFLACAIDAVVLGGVFFIDELWLLSMALFVHGLLGAVYGLARQSYLAEVVPPRWRARAMSSLGGVFRIGHLLGPLAGALVTLTWDVPHAFLMAAGMSAVAASVTLVMPDLPADSPRRQTAGQPHPRVWDVLKQHRRVLLTIGVGCLGTMLVRTARQTIVPLWCEANGIDPSTTSLIYAFSMSFEILLFFPGGAIMDRFGRWWVSVPSLIVMGVGFVLLPLTDTVTSIAIAAGVLGLGNGLSSGIVMTLGADASPDVGRPQFLASWRVLADSGSFAGPAIVSVVSTVATLGLASVVIGVLCWGTAVWLTKWLPPPAAVGGRLVDQTP